MLVPVIGLCVSANFDKLFIKHSKFYTSQILMNQKNCNTSMTKIFAPVYWSNIYRFPLFYEIVSDDSETPEGDMWELESKIFPEAASFWNPLEAYFIIY